jgi:GTPase SAR1 family protein
VIGSSGSGKTTNILKFLGYDFKTGKNGLTPIGSLSTEHLVFQTFSKIKFCKETINYAALPNNMSMCHSNTFVG